MLEALLAVGIRIALALESLAETMKSAKLAADGKPAAAAPAKAAEAPAAAATVLVKEADDLFGDEERKPLTETEVKAIGKKAAEDKGRPFVKEALKKFGADSMKELKPEHYQGFADHVQAK